jgi:hypothetical protein
MYRNYVCVAALCLTLALAGSAGAQLGQGKVLFEYWDGIGGTSVDNDLRTNANFPNNPTSSVWLDKFQSPSGRADNYGVRGRAYLTPPETGEYTFWVAGDDNCQLWLSTDDNPANATMIAQVASWTGVAEWGKEAGQKSAPQALVAGQKYYIEGLMKEGGGGDSLDVGWAGPGIGNTTTVIAGKYCTAFIRNPEPLFLAQNPKPADKAVDFLGATFEWTPGITAVAHEVYFGTTPELTAADQKPALPGVPMYYHFEPMEPGKTYYWRVDEVDAAGNKYTGKVWSFTVMPIEANTPSPSSGVANAPLTLTLGWKAGQSAMSHNVYLGTDEVAVTAGEAAFVANVAETKYTPANLLPATTYYWRVDEVDAAGIKIPGDVWSFSTVPVIEPVDDPSLVGWWTFDTEPANSLTALDMSGNGRHGVLVGGIKFVSDVFMGPVLQLPGGDGKYVNIGAVGISGNDPTTIACWAKADHTNIPDWTLIFGFTGDAAGAGGNGSHLSIDSLGGPGGVGAHAWGWEETMFSDQEALEWHHYAVTYDGTTIRYYGDGVEMDSDVGKSNVQNLAIRGDRVHIGKRRTQESSFPGKVDDCRVYNRVLSAEEIAAIGTPQKNIVWVSFHAADDKPVAEAAAVGFTQASDIGYTDLLKAQGYNVVRYVSTGTPDAALLNAADLVIISRAAPSGHYQNANATNWNKISAPTMVLGGYVIRKNRLGFSTGNTIPDTTGDIKLTVLDPMHPIFDGVALAADGTMASLYAGVVPIPTPAATMSRGISIVTEPAGAEGTVLAVVSASSAATGPAGAMVIAEWPAGASVIHDGGAGTDVLAGPRLVFLTGSREPDGVTGGQAAAVFDLYDDGALMFLNAVNYLLNPPPEPPAPAGTSSLINGGFEDGVLAPWGTYGALTATVVTTLEGAAVAEPVAEGTYCLFVDLPAKAANFWDAGLQPKPIVFEAGKKYTFSVWLKAKTADVQINLKPELAADPWTGYGELMATVTTQWQEFSVTTPVFATTINPPGLTLHVGHATGGFWVDGARLYEGDYAPAP